MQVLKRDRAVLGDLGEASMRPASTIKRRKKGSRLANRRVSFAPDDQLKTMHLYTKVQHPAPATTSQPPFLPCWTFVCLLQQSRIVW